MFLWEGITALNARNYEKKLGFIIANVCDKNRRFLTKIYRGTEKKNITTIK